VSEDPRLEAWLNELLATPGLTGLKDRREAWRVHVAESLVAVDTVSAFPGTIVDVGSGGGAPGIPLAAALPDREVTLLESQRRKCDFLERAAATFPNVRIVCGRAEEQETDRYGVALAKALAPPAVAAEWCLPLVAPGGAAILYVGRRARLDTLPQVAARLAAELVPGPDGLAVLLKTGPTPLGFPRRPGVARKRPLA
jgi:16S rRNA (guanine527-N7)-methyltransferase